MPFGAPTSLNHCSPVLILITSLSSVAFGDVGTYCTVPGEETTTYELYPGLPKSKWAVSALDSSFILCVDCCNRISNRTRHLLRFGFILASFFNACSKIC